MAPSAHNLILIDGHSLIHRAFFALPPLTTTAGIPTNAVYGFTMMLNRLIQDEKPEYLAVAFDMEKPTFRHTMYPAYKKERPPMDDALRSQIPSVKQLVRAYNIPTFEVEGYEADDIIGTLAQKAEEDGLSVLIITGDMDVLQLVTSKVTALITRRGIKDMERFGIDEVKQTLGVHPSQVADWKGLAGDVSDSIPGVPRIGPKTAARLLEQYGSVENLLHHGGKVKGKVGESLRLHRDQALLSKGLAQIDRDAPVDVTWDELKWSGPNPEELAEIYRRMEFRRLLEDLTEEYDLGDSTSEPSKRPGRGAFQRIPVEVLNDLKEIEEAWHEDARTEKVLAVLPVWEGKMPRDAALIGLAWAGRKRACYIPIGHDDGNTLARDDVTRVFALLFGPLSDDASQRVTYDLKILHHLLAGWGWSDECQLDDVLLQAYVNDPGQSNTLEDIARRFELELPASWKETDKSKLTLASMAPQDLGKVAGVQCQVLLTVHPLLNEALSEQQTSDVYKNLELPLVNVLGAMERRGIRIDPGQLLEISREMTDRIEALEENVYALADERFNLRSPRQTAQILFEKLQLPVIAKTKSGPSTSAEVLEQLAGDHEIAEVILDYRQLQKLKSTYVDALPALVNEKTGRLHTTFNQAVAATGRLSSTGPNLQNIPVRTAEGRRIRKVFVAEEGYTLVKADYSQIELRILAHISQDDELVQAFRDGADIHRKTAAEILGIDGDDVTESQRDAAKAINFGIVYGISSFGLARDTGLSRAEAQEFIDRYFQRYPGVARAMQEAVETARTLGYVRTLLGRRRYVPDIRNRRWHTRKLAERTAINTPIQGSAADIIKEAMIAVDRRIRLEDYNAHVLLQVHDELLIETVSDDVEAVARLVKEEMENAASLIVPLVADVQAGPNWLDQHPVLC